MIAIEILGIPRPGGSKTAGISRKSGRLFVRPANPNTSIWRAQVEVAARQQYSGPLLTSAIDMTYEFRFPRPQAHFCTGKRSAELKKTAPYWHTSKPDLTKIIRSTEDALTGIVWSDDSKVCRRVELKRYCSENERPGVSMKIRTLESTCAGK